MKKTNCCGQCAEICDEDIEGNAYCEYQTMIINCADEACNYFKLKNEDFE